MNLHRDKLLGPPSLSEIGYSRHDTFHVRMLGSTPPSEIWRLGGVTIVLIHGTWARGTRFNRLQEALAVRFPGANIQHATWSGRNSSRARFKAAQSLKEQLVNLSAPRYLVGHSHGGSIGVHVASQLPSLVAGVVTLNTPFIVPHRRREWVGTFLPLIAMMTAMLVHNWLIWNVQPVNDFYVWLYRAYDARYIQYGVFALVAIVIGSFILARKQGSAAAESLLAQLDGLRIPPENLLVLRRPGDEASAALGALYTIDWIMNRLAYYSLICGVALLFVYLSASVFFGARSISLPGSDAAVIAVAIMLAAAVSQGLAYGAQHALLWPWLYCSADFSPPGKYQTLNLQPSERSTADKTGLFHSAIYNDPETISVLMDWIASQQAPPVLGVG